MKYWRLIQWDVFILLGFLLLPLLVFGDVTLGGKTMLPADNLGQWAPWTAVTEPLGITSPPQNSLLTDLVLENYAWKRFINQSIQQKELPLWNPYLFGGVPFLATGQHAAYYPFSFFFLFLPLWAAYGWYTVSQLALAGALMYVYGRCLHMRRASAFIAGLIFQGCGFMVVSAAVFPMVVGAAVWLPLLLACIEQISQHAAALPRRAFVWTAVGSIALACQIFAGHVEITYYTLLLMGLYAAWRWLGALRSRASWQNLASIAAWWAALVLLGLMLGGVQIIPLYEVGQTNFREGSASFDEVRSWAFPSRHVLVWLMPNFYGNPAQHRYTDALSGERVAYTTNAAGQTNPHGANSSDWGIKNYVEGAAYLGILSLFLAGLGVYAGWRKAARRQQTAFFVGMGFFAVAFIFGTPLYALLYYGLPFINQLHTPFRWVFPLSLFVAVLAGFGADYLAETRAWPTFAAWQTFRQGLTPEALNVWASDNRVPAWLRPFVLWASPSLVTALAGLAFWSGLLVVIGLYGSRLTYGRLEPFIDRVFQGMALAPDAFASARAFYSTEFPQVLVLGLFLIGTGAVLRVSRCPIYVRHRPVWEWMAAGLLILDLFLANVGFHAAVNPAILAYEPPMVQWLKSQPGLWRITTYAPHGDKPFNANAAWLFDLADVRGYDSIIPKQYTQFMTAVEAQNELVYNRIQPLTQPASLQSPLLDILGVKYVITAETIDLPRYRLAWQGDGLRVYENGEVLPRAYLLYGEATAVVPDPMAALTQLDPRHYAIFAQNEAPPQVFASSRPAQNVQETPILSYGLQEITIHATANGPGWLILNDSYAPGWKAFARPFNGSERDEKELPLYRVNGNFRGVYLEAGDWVVRYRYSPLSFKVGALASFMGGIVLLFAVGVWGWQGLSRSGGTLSTTRSLAKNSAAPMLLNLFNKFIDFGFAAFYLRVLGPAEAGSFAFAIATAGLFDILANFGLNILLIREVSQKKEQASRYLLNTTVLRLGTAVMGALPVLLYLASISRANNPPTSAELWAVAFIMMGMVFSGMAQGVTGMFYVYEQAETPAAMTTATTILKVGLGVMALLLGYSFVGLAAVSILVNIFTLTILAIVAFRSFPLRGPWVVDWALQKEMLRRGYPLMLIHLLQTIFISIDVVLIKQINGETVVGWYSSAYKWFNAFQIIPSFFTLALFPIISREIAQSLEGARRMYMMSLKVMLLLALPLALFTSFLAYPLVGLVGGAEFLPHGAIALQLVVWSIPVGWLNSVTNYVLIALGLEHLQPRAFALAVGFNIVANVLFLPRFSYVAASIITILSEMVLLSLFYFFLRQKWPGLDWAGLLGRPLLVAGLTAVGMALGSQIHLIVGLLMGALLYPGGLLLFRVLGDEEWRIFQAILPAPIARRFSRLPK